MKKIIILLICIFSLTSCFSHKNTENKYLENTETNSGNIEKQVITENTMQTGSENTEKQEEKNLPTEYEVITEKAYFYNNPNDTEPRKTYVMKGDIILVNHEKSTENMMFVSYTNSAGKMTEGYLKKDTIQSVKILSMDEIQEISQCYRQYNLIDNSSNKMMVEFYFVGKCQKLDTAKTVTNSMGTPIFTLSSGQKVYARMFSKQNPPSDGIDGGAGIYRKLGKDTFFVQGNQISLKKYVGDDGMNPPFYEFVIEVKFNSNHKNTLINSGNSSIG